MAVRRKPQRKKKPDSQGLRPPELLSGKQPDDLTHLAEAVAGDGGVVIGIYRDPLGGGWLVLAGLPVTKVEPTPYQRDLSDAHVKRLAGAIEKLGRFLDPIIVVREGDGYWTPNGSHRLAALKRLGARTITALVVPDETVARRILVLNTEKAHNLRERSLEVSRLAEAMAKLDDRPENEFETEFEEPALITLGLCYQENGRFAGAQYHPVLKRVDAFFDTKLSKALVERKKRAGKLLELDEAVGEVVKKLKEKGFESPYLKAFVVARCNPIRFVKGAPPAYEEVIDKMLASAKKFDVGKVKPGQIQVSGGVAEE
ncbi:MAG: ParB N-terminal domain-containing protein [Gemmatimonadales bacterium]